jgi:hypothetical protein
MSHGNRRQRLRVWALLNGRSILRVMSLWLSRTRQRTEECWRVSTTANA